MEGMMGMSAINGWNFESQRNYGRNDRNECNKGWRHAINGKLH